MKLVTPRRRANPLTSTMTIELLHGFIDDGGVEALEEFLALEGTQDALIGYHMSLGRHIRNTYIFPTMVEDTPEHEQFMHEYPDEHIDDISFEIIMELHNMLKSLRADGVDLLTFGRKKKKGIDRVLEIIENNDKINTSGQALSHKSFDENGYHD